MFLGRYLSPLNPFGGASSKASPKSYHKEATGTAMQTVRKHASDHELKLYGSCFWCAVPLLSGGNMWR